MFVVVICSDRNEIMPKVRSSIMSECYPNLKSSLPTRTNDKTQSGDQLGAVQEVRTTYRDNFNKSEKIVFAKDSRNFTLKSVDKDFARILDAGTVKSTLQVPGFKGHIPKNVRNIKKYEHSRGDVAHPVNNNLRLTQRGMGCVLGYTGRWSNEFVFCAFLNSSFFVQGTSLTSFKACSAKEPLLVIHAPPMGRLLEKPEIHCD